MTDIPRVGVGAPLERDGKVLFVHRRRAPEVGHWSPVGGKPEFMEALEDAVKREVLEEIGVEILSPAFADRVRSPRAG